MDILARVRDRVQVRGRFDGDVLAQAVRDVVQMPGETSRGFVDGAPGRAPARCTYPLSSRLLAISSNRYQVCLFRPPRGYRSLCCFGATARRGLASQLDCKIWEACRGPPRLPRLSSTPSASGRLGSSLATAPPGGITRFGKSIRKRGSCGPIPRSNVLLAIGTGKPRLSAFGDDLRNIAKTLVRLATETGLIAEEFLLDHADLDLADSYFRLNVPKGLEEVGLLEYAVMSTIASATMAYLESQEASEQVTGCVHRLQAPTAEEIANGTFLCPGLKRKMERKWKKNYVNLSADEEKWLGTEPLHSRSFFSPLDHLETRERHVQMVFATPKVHQLAGMLTAPICSRSREMQAAENLCSRLS
jgi:hypothetical protein